MREVFETHTSLPMLVLWRSKHRGQSWITALGRGDRLGHHLPRHRAGGERGPALRLYRQSVRLITFLAAQTGVEAPPYEVPSSRFWSIGYTALSRAPAAQMRPSTRACAACTSCGPRSTR